MTDDESEYGNGRETPGYDPGSGWEADQEVEDEESADSRESDSDGGREVKPWQVKVDFIKDPAFDSPTQQEWNRLIPIVGNVVVVWTGEGPPLEFSAKLIVQAEDHSDAKRRAVDEIQRRLVSEGLTGWMIHPDDAWPESDEDEGAVKSGGVVGYDPGAPPDEG